MTIALRRATPSNLEQLVEFALSEAGEAESFELPAEEQAAIRRRDRAHYRAWLDGEETTPSLPAGP